MDEQKRIAQRRLIEKVFRLVCGSATWTAVVVLACLLYHVTKSGIPWLSSHFITNFASRFPEKAGIYAPLWGSVWLLGLTAMIAIPMGVATALYLEEFAPKNKLTGLIDLNISNLAGVPSIVYGILGLAVFVRALALDRSLIAGALTMSLLVLPVIIMAAREAIRAVPSTLRQASLAMGATKWQTIWHQVLPVATPGILTGVILSLSRAMGETAPLIMIGAFAYVRFVPEGPMDEFSVLPIQIFNWAARPQESFHGLAAAGILVLLAVLLLMNGAAVFIRHKYQRHD